VLHQSSTTHGYNSGGYHAASFTNEKVIQKFSFAVDSNATNALEILTSKKILD
jgi:hypothetical protein